MEVEGQRVAAIHCAVREHPEGGGHQGQISVRFISLEGCPEDFGKSVTTVTNTQNQVEQRDFVALDPIQARLRDEMAIILGKTYELKRGEQIIPSQEIGCTVMEAATIPAFSGAENSQSREISEKIGKWGC